MTNTDSIRQALVTLLPGGERLTAVRTLATGFSNETYRLEGLDAILRLPPSAGAVLDGHDVLGQARIYRALGEMPGAPPVPAITHIGDDPAVLGVPFFVMGLVPGEALHDLDMQPWFTDVPPERRTEMCRDWIAAFARLATLPTLDVLGPAVSAEDYVRRWRGVAAEAEAGELVDLYDRLLALSAPVSGAPSLVHGDPKISNLMWDEGRISAMLDWEMALNSEPLSDLGYLLFFFASPFHGATRGPAQSGMLDRAGVIDCWEQTSSRSAAGVEWHEIAQIGKLCTIMAKGIHMIATGASSDPKFAAFRNYFDASQAAMRAMLDAYTGDAA
ncbi:phosphotransferase family protein [uncultured Sphingomonas sp.]|uniref:phosphotransferase family protein n=1 Tax=uncultured Sphingomonas sp. TaxID=158754 RepID=UPI00261F7738|nr:phosphotransferase family protein [uncultured Sphingomonas sp.]